MCSGHTRVAEAVAATVKAAVEVPETAVAAAEMVAERAARARRAEVAGR